MLPAVVQVAKPVRAHALACALERALGVAPPTAPAGRQSAATTVSPGPLRILLVEDNPVNQRVATPRKSAAAGRHEFPRATPTA